MRVDALEVTVRARFGGRLCRPMRPVVGDPAPCAEPGVVIQAGRLHRVEVGRHFEHFPMSSHCVGTGVVTQSVPRLDASEQKSPRVHAVKLTIGFRKVVVPGFPAGRPFAGRHQFDVGRRSTACCAERRGDQANGRWVTMGEVDWIGAGIEGGLHLRGVVIG